MDERKENVGEDRPADVCLRWLDFVYAFKEVQYNNEAHTDRDWYKINPSDIFFIGCETIIENKEKTLKINTILISIANLQSKMLKKPNLMSDIVHLLFQMLEKEKHGKTFIAKKVMVLIFGMIKLKSHDFILEAEQWITEFNNIIGDRDNFDTIDNLYELPLTSRGQEVKNGINGYGERLRKQLWDVLNLDVLFEDMTNRQPQWSIRLMKIIDHLSAFCASREPDGNSWDIVKEYGQWLLHLHHRFVEEYNDNAFDSLLNFLFMDLMDRENSDNSLESFLDMENLTVIMNTLLEYVKGFEKNMQSCLLYELFNFLSSGLEMEINRSQLLFVHLPNITAIGFGCKNVDVTLLLLQYGSLSFTSKYRKELLTTSLNFIKSVYDLFLTKEQAKIQNDLIVKRIESLSVAYETIDHLLAFIPSSNEEEASDNLEASTSIASWNDATTTGCKDMSIGFSTPADSINLLKALLKLACLMIKSGSNINYSFASLLPKLFYRTDFADVPASFPFKYFPDCIQRKSALQWKIEKHQLAMDVLNVCITCYERRVGSTFQICGVMIPKLTNNLDRTGLDDMSKYRILQDFLIFCIEKMKSSQHVNTLITHGLDLISLLMPVPRDETEQTDPKQFLIDIAESVEKLGGTSSLLLLKTSCDTLVPRLVAEEQGKLKNLFLVLIKRCNRNDIRNVFLLSRKWLLDARFTNVRELMYAFGEKKINSKTLQSVCELVTTFISIEGKLLEAYQGLPNNCLDWIINDITSSNTSKFNGLLKNLLRLSLYQALIPERLEFYLKMQQQLESNLMETLDSELPKEVVDDDKTMDWLQSCIRRIDQMQVPRYIKLQAFLHQLMKTFTEKPNGGGEKESTYGGGKEESIVGGRDEESTIAARFQNFESHIKALPWNLQKREGLLKYGYSDDFWMKRIDIEVTTNGMLNLDENLRQSLLSCYGDYAGILNSLNIPSIIVDGATTKTADIFGDELSLADLKGRRSIVVKTIDKSVDGRQQNILEKKFSLQMREEEIERDLQAMASKPPKQQTFRIRLNTTFYECSLCCGQQIIGCYSPVGGEHCERPLEIGFRSDSGFISIYHNGMEIENSEFLLMNQGLFIYKAYTSGHPYDTSEVWMEFFIKMLEVENLVPAIILPYHFPNRSTWEGLRRWASPDIVCTYITCDFDYSNEWRTYYDSRPESVGNGKDIILTKGFTSKERRTSFSFQRQISVNVNKDLGGMLSDVAMQQLLDHSVLKNFRFLGKQLVLLLNRLVDTGAWNINILSDNFNYDRWKMNLKDGSFKDQTKDDIVKMLDDFLLKQVENHLTELNLKMMLFTQRRQFHQLRALLSKNMKSQLVFKYTPSLLLKLDKLLKKHLACIPINTLSENMQDELIHWIFENEDRVWRFRGGREFETISQFLNFLSHYNKETKCFPGIIVHLKKQGEIHCSNGEIKVSDVVGYAIGEYVCDDEEEQGEKPIDDIYEIVTAWIHPNYRGLQLSTQIYLETFKQVSSKYVTFDLLRHRVDHVINSSFVLRILKGVFQRKERFFRIEKSYEVTTENGVEQFEKVTVNRLPIAFCLQVQENYIPWVLILVSIFMFVISVLFGRY